MITLPRMIACFVLGCCVLIGPIGLRAQDKDKDKKDNDPFKLKKDTDKKKDDDPFKLKKKPVEPKKEEKKGPPPEEWPTFKQKFEAKILKIGGELNNEFTIEIQVVDEAKVAKLQQWEAQQAFNINSAKTEKEVFDRTLEYNREVAARRADIFTPKQYDVRAAEKVKIRMMDAPVEYDDKGFIKKWTAKELAELKGNTKLPGFPTTLETLRVNQMVHIYLVPAPRLKEDPKLKKKRNEDDPPAPKELPEAVVIVVHPAPLLK